MRILCVAFSGLLVAAACAAAEEAGGQAPSGAAGPFDEASLAQVLLVQALGEFELDEEAAVRAVVRYNGLCRELAELEAMRGTLSRELAELASGEASTTYLDKLEALRSIDARTAEVRMTGYAHVLEPLPPRAAARVYLLMSSMAAHIREMRAGLAAQVCVDGSAPLDSLPPRTPEEEVRAVLDAWAEHVERQNLDGMMAFCSADFEDEDFENKAGVRSFIKQAMDMGYLNGIEARLDVTEIRVDGETAEANPIQLTGDFGMLTLSFELRREEAGWRVVAMEDQGL